jgi:NhaP-type Na+/H+ or K+/H+ antiporter
VEHGLDPAVLAVVAGSAVLWSLLSARLESWNVTAPMAFVALGLVFTHGPLALIDLDLQSSAVRSVAEVTLALVLFVDASRVNVRELRADAGLPARLLGIGLPLTIGFGFLVAAGLYHGTDLWVLALIATSVAPTDAALGAAIMQDKRVPARIRRVLNVESGLNDGIATPLVGVFLAGAATAEAVHGAHSAVTAVAELFGGAAIGLGIGLLGAVLLRVAVAHGFSAPAFQSLMPLGLALLAYGVSVQVGANGFVAAFVGGMAFGSLLPPALEAAIGLADDGGEVLSLLTWFLVGAVMVVPAVQDAQWRDVAFAVLALTVVRMLAVAISCLGLGLHGRTIAFIGWFGPRGLASVVFALLAVDSLTSPDSNRVLSTVTLTVLVSVVAHGVTASPFAARYGAAAAGLHPLRPEHAPTPELRARSISGARAGRTRQRDPQ